MVIVVGASVWKAVPCACACASARTHTHPVQSVRTGRLGDTGRDMVHVSLKPPPARTGVWAWGRPSAPPTERALSSPPRPRPPSLPPPLRSGNLLEAAGLVSGRARIQTRDSAHLPYSHAQQLLRARERLGSSRPVLIGGAGVWEGQVTVASESQLAEVQRSPLRPVPAHPGCAENGRIAPRTAFPGHGAASALKRSHSPLRDAVAG